MFKKFSYWFLGITVLLVLGLIGIINTGPKKEVQIETGTQDVASESTTTQIVASTSQVFNTKDAAPVITQEREQKTLETKPLVQDDSEYYSVTQVVDGDTVKVSVNGKIETLRLIGLDTPETVDPRKEVQCFGKEASKKAKELLIGKRIKLEKDPTQGNLDKYGRTLAYIYREDGLFYNKYMIEQGYAHEYTYNIPYKYQAEFKQAQKTAQANQSGLWNPNTCAGNTTSAAKGQTTTAATQTTGKYYTSSASNATKYYPDTCPDWQNLSKSNLRTFNTLEELLVVYPNRTLSSQCQ